MVALSLAGLLLLIGLKPENIEDVPVAFKGRFRSMKAYLQTHPNEWEYTLFLPPESERAFEQSFREMEMRRVSSKEISHFLENQYPLQTRLKNVGEELAVLPGRQGEWFSIRALTLSIYNPAT